MRSAVVLAQQCIFHDNDKVEEPQVPESVILSFNWMNPQSRAGDSGVRMAADVKTDNQDSDISCKEQGGNGYSLYATAVFPQGE